MEYSLLDQWPKDDDGTPEPAALLCNGSDYPDELALMCSLLESFSIPHYAKHQGSAQYMSLLFGHAAAGIEIYVPASLLEKAQALLDAPPAFDETAEEDPAP